MSDNALNNAVGPRPAAPLTAYVNAFRAGRAETAPAPDGQPDPDALRRQIAALTPPQRAAAARQAEILGALGQGLAGRPYAERRALLAHMTPALAARGVDPAAIAGFDPTDVNLSAAMTQAAGLKGMLEA
jgi:hypothetical protein